MKENIDIRVQKTYNMLVIAFLKMLEEKKYEEITINDLCKEAGIRRATFYQHFNDKFGFFVFTVKTIQKKVKENTKELYKSDSTETFYINLCKYAIELLEQNEQIVYSIFQSNMFSLMADILVDEFAKDVETQLKEDNIDKYNQTMLAQIITGGFLQLAKWWFLNKTTVNKEEMLKEVETLIKNNQFLK